MTLRLNGSTSGYTEIDAPAVAGSNTVILPSGNGSANQFLKNGSTAGSLGWSSMVETATGVGMGVSSPVRQLHLAGSSNCELVLEQTGGKSDNRKYNFLVDGGSSTVTPNFALRILNDAGSAEVVRAFSYNGTTGNFAFNSGFGSVATAYACRAWVVYDAAGTVGASGNVSSVTKVSTGNWTINFTNAMPDGNYVSVGCNNGLLGGYNFVSASGSNFGSGQRTTTACSVATVDRAGSGIDSTANYWAFFR